jgi:hypothetical protein
MNTPRINFTPPPREPLGNCDACGYPLPDDKLTRYTAPGARRFKLCGICFNSPAGIVVEYPGLRDEKVLKTLAYIGNALLEALQK